MIETFKPSKSTVTNPGTVAWAFSKAKEKIIRLVPPLEIISALIPSIAECAHPCEEAISAGMFYEIANNTDGLLDGRKPYITEAQARTVAEGLAAETGASYQLWSATRLIEVISPIPT